MNISVRKAENGFLLEVWYPAKAGSTSNSPMGMGGDSKTFVYPTMKEALAQIEVLLTYNA